MKADLQCQIKKKVGPWDIVSVAMGHYQAGIEMFYMKGK